MGSRFVPGHLPPRLAVPVALGSRVQLMAPFLIPISQAGLWRAAASHPSSPVCVKSRESWLQEQMRPRAFSAFSFFPSLPLPPALYPGCFSAVVLITCLYKHLSGNLPPSLEMLPGSDAPEDAQPLSAPAPEGMAAEMAPRALGPKGPYSDRGHPTVLTSLKQELWGLAWFCCFRFVLARRARLSPRLHP